VARDRQKAKQRQAERRAKRLESEGRDPSEAPPEPREPEAPEGAGSADLAAIPPGEDGRPEPHLAAGATSEHLGAPDAIIEDEPDLDDDELEDYDFEDEEQPLEEPTTTGPRGVRGGRAKAEERHRNRLIAFLIASWAELQRVQWPNRKQLTQMTGVVLVFVLIAGGYLGLLDAIFSRLIQQII
jgi:preprotein translocase subunit SecE